MDFFVNENKQYFWFHAALITLIKRRTVSSFDLYRVVSSVSLVLSTIGKRLKRVSTFTSHFKSIISIFPANGFIEY